MRRNAVWLIVAIAFVGCSDKAKPNGDPVRGSLHAATGYLIDAQQPDGAWRSDTDGTMRDGPTLTAHTAKLMFHLQWYDDRTGASYRAACDYLLSVDPNDTRLEYPVYTASQVCMALSITHQWPEPWRQLLMRYRLDEQHGWQPDDAGYGGWTDRGLPTKRADAINGNAAGSGANLSSTLFAVGAILKTGWGDDPELDVALAFVKQCQNYNDRVTAHDDGGFFFGPDAIDRSKAGATETDGGRRARSDAPATTDGLRALIRLGLPRDHPRVVVARRWLLDRFTVDTVPGEFAPDRERERDAYYYYYCWSLAHAMMAVGESRVIEHNGRKIDWPAELAAALIERQHTDGSWSSDNPLAKENNPLVATPFAAAALAICHRYLTPGTPANPGDP